MSEENIREYNFAVPGMIDRHIPGIPGIWPFGSRVQVNEDTNQVVNVWPEGVEPIIPKPVQEKSAQAEPAPETPPALENQPVDATQQLSEAVKNL